MNSLRKVTLAIAARRGSEYTKQILQLVVGD